ncbi:MAG: sigmaK-factor processing regulatory BofA [Methanocalculus sp. MSAO_Arc2]|uniref:pro-sigmaK processing inhibitor BofA family protein n=1 Tax=Methanocalculus sp. MSAO_Arc2 TaxID=2293855 RepID=UPI000FEDA6BB|nr:MAG: sigmaK-factor processing regulatory BofA [Methanocalculus sp. MSAO_Arc2]
MFGSLFGIFIAVVIAIAIYYLLKKGVYLAYNAVIGIVILFILNATGLTDIPINLVTILISAIGGIFGVIIIILLYLLGIPL